MYLVFDTETSNVPQDNVELDHPCQARLMQLACVLLDEKLKEIKSYNTLIKLPEYVEINQYAYNKHKLTKDYVRKYGIIQEHALNVFLDFFNNAEVVVAFGLNFDVKILDIEHQLLCGDRIPWATKKSACLMEVSTPIVKLSFAGGKLNKFGQRYKWPKLEEAYAFFTHKLIDGAHNAKDDVRSTTEILQCLVEEYQINFVDNVRAA